MDYLLRVVYVLLKSAASLLNSWQESLHLISFLLQLLP